jgi:DNA-binding MarR family transcriptional regulator
MRIKDLVHTLGAIETEFGLDIIDLQLLVAAQDRWEQNETIRITDLIRDWKIASPATIHYRVSKDLVKKKMVKLEANPEDAREKFVVEGTSFKKLKKFLGEEGKTK